jgi:uncharacterized protein
VVAATELNLREVERYLRRLADRWPLERAMLGGARVDDHRRAPAQRERGEEYVVLLVSQAFDGTPWLERVHQAESLWDGETMGAAVEAHCYTPVELERKRELPVVAWVLRRGIDLLAG